MKLSDLKYLLAYIIPLSGFFALSQEGVAAYTSFIIAFVIVPLAEQIMPRQTSNLAEDEATSKRQSKFFDYLLYLNVPLLYLLLAAFFIRLSGWSEISTFDLVGYCLSVGVILGSSGINVAHELGHKNGKFELLCSKLLLLPNYYLHFNIEHNHGHHVHVATPKDPATSRKDESLYFFWIRSIIGSYRSAWKIESKRLAQKNIQVLDHRNQMLHFLLYQSIYFGLVAIVFDLRTALFTLVIGLIGVLLLETINYIEHYGLLRKQLENGRYERVKVTHSWNSNFEIGRIILYELTRHSDHHYKANKKYQLLNHYEESPQLPMGYPASMLIALVPPLWKRIMNKRLDQYQQRIMA